MTIENRTSMPVDIFYEPGPTVKKETTVEAMSSHRLTIARVVWTNRVIARDSSGTVVFDQVITWGDIKRTRRIVIDGP